MFFFVQVDPNAYPNAHTLQSQSISGFQTATIYTGKPYGNSELRTPTVSFEWMLSQSQSRLRYIWGWLDQTVTVKVRRGNL